MAASSVPEVRYAKSGDIHVAYQVFGNGPLNLIHTPGSVSHLEYEWDNPGFRQFLESLGSFARVAIFDKRGTGMSDRFTGIPTFEERMDDIRAVMDAAGFNQAVLFGLSEGVPMSILFAASYPSRTKGLVLYGGEAKGAWSPDYPWQATREQREESIRKTETSWGSEEWAKRVTAALAPSRLGDEKFVQWFRGLFRAGCTPGSAVTLSRSEMNMDVRSVLPAIHVPTLVIHLTGDMSSDVGEGRYLAQHIPGARLLELPGIDHFFYVDGKLVEKISQEVKEFATGLEPAAQTDRLLTTVLFTDIVDSTKKATDLGDSGWRSLLEKHNGVVKDIILRYNGRVVKNTGDGFLAIFDGPTRALKSAWEISKSSAQVGVGIRAGVHTGECIIGPSDVSGIAIHIASRVLGEASGGQVMVSSTVKDLVYGSGIAFKDEGERELKGIDDKRRLYSVASIG